MSVNTPLVRPTQSPVKIDPTSKSTQSDGFAWPTFRLLNKLARSTLSKPYDLSPNTHYHLLAIANTRGWFAAARFNGSAYELGLSPLEDLRSFQKAAKTGTENDLTFKRTVPLAQGKPNILAFANHDSRLFVGLESGHALVFDSATLFTPGQDPIQPTSSRQLQSSPLKQIAANPGTEAGLVDRIAIVGDGFVQIFDMQLEPQGGWNATDASTTPAGVAWSPKGKHIAIGLQSGDILTFPLTNMANPNKHIPPTFDGQLVSISWTGPGHTFRTSYASQQEPALHLVMLDTKTNTGSYYNLMHPFTSGDRTFQSPYLLHLPQWDEDASASEHHNSLFVFGDSTSVDLEILAHDKTTWYQQSQENQVSLPLNSDMDDTTLLSLDLDLTETSTSMPIMYAYLNDGTLQAWHLEHSKPYALMSTPGNQAQATAPGVIQPDSSMSTGSDPAPKPAVSAFGQPAAPSAFGQSSFGAAKPAFGAASAFGRSAAPSVGFGAFASSTPSAFGQAASTTSAFGASTTPASGGFGAFGGAPSAFGGGASGGSAFGSQTSGGFGAFSNNSNGSAFGNAGSTSAFGSTPAAPAPPAEMTREASMADDTPSFGGLSLGSSNAGASSTSTRAGGMFGAFGSGTSTTPASGSAFGASSGSSFIKPSTGFAAFAPSADSPFAKPSTPATSAFGAGTTPTALSSTPASTTTSSANSAFGKSAFGQSSFGQPSGFGKPAFGQSAFGQPAQPAAAAAASTATAPASGGFGSFASKPASFGSAAPASSASTFGSGGGFGSFAGTTSSFTSALNKDAEAKPAETSSPFGSAASTTPAASSTSTTTPASAFGSMTPATPSPFDSTTPAASPFGAFGKPAATSVFGQPAAAPAFGQPAFTTPTTPTPNKPSAVPGIVSPSSSPEADEAKPAPSPETPVSAFKSSQPPVTTGAFANLQASPSAFKPSSGFGVFGGVSSSSPFMKPAEQKPAPVSIFANLGAGGSASASSTPPGKPPGGAPTFGSSSFGTTSSFGAAAKPIPPASPTTPLGAPKSGGFGAFSGSSGAFSAFSGTKSSFTELLKASKEEENVETKGPKTPEPVEDKEVGGKNKVSPSKSEGSLAADTSYGDISSTGSSFVDVRDEGRQEGEGDGGRGRGDEQSDEDDGSEYVPGSDDEEEEEEEDDGEEEDFDDLSEDHVSDNEDEEGEDGEEEEDETTRPDPAAVPLPRSESSTPQPEIKVDRAKTPPGTPPKQAEESKSAASTAVSSPSPPFGLGLGRPSTRPARSSPLANAPVSGEDDGGAVAAEGSASPKPPRTPKPATAALPTPTFPHAKTTPATGPAPLFGNLPARPASTPAAGTPPLFGAPSAPSPFGAAAPAGDKAAKPLFGAGAPPQQGSFFGQQAKPGAAGSAIAPPSIGMFGDAAPVPSTSTTALPVSFNIPKPVQTPTGPTSLFGKVTSPPTPAQGTPQPFNLPAFSLAPSAASSPAPVSSMFGSPAPLEGAGFGGATPQPKVPTFFTNPQSQKGAAAAGATSPPSFNLGAKPMLFSTPPKVGPQAPAAPATPPNPPPRPPPELSMEEGMQKECALLIMNLEAELEELGLRAQEVLQRQQYLAKPAGGSWNRADLGDSSKWSLGNLKQFGQVLFKYGDELSALKETREKLKDDIRELNTSLLKANTRKEEIARFNKAKTDPEFAKMLKTRSLGPEHSETQTQLRRGIRTMRDRITKLESNLQSSKKKLAESVSGKPSIKAPTLDTVNRTFRNIELVLSQQADEVHRLTLRLKKVNLDAASSPALSTPVRDARLPDAIRRGGVHVRAPNVAVATAAALNAERSAAKLKKALLAVRKEPLLNTNVNSAKPPPTVGATPQEQYETPQRGGGKWEPSASLSTPPAFPGFPKATPATPATPLSAPDFGEFTLPPDDNFSVSASLPGSSRRGGSAKKHSSVQLPKKSPGTPSVTPAAASFDWGPLPTFNATPPLNSLAAAFTTPKT